MQRVAVSFLGNLLAATEAVGNDEPVGGGLADGGEKFQLSDGFRNFVLLFFEAEGPGHSATSRGGRGELDAHAAQHGFLGSHLHDGLVMAVAVDERLARQLGDGEILRVLFQEFAEQEDLLRERAGAFVFGEQVNEFVAENSGAARFEDDDRRAGFNFDVQLVHDPEEQALGAVEHTDVVKRAAAAEMGARDEDVEAGGFENFGGGPGG